MTIQPAPIQPATIQPAPLVIAEGLDEALQALADGATPIAGGTDLVVGSRQSKDLLQGPLVAIDRIAELQTIDATADDGLSIGAGVSHAKLMSAAVIVANYTALADAAALIGSPATRNVGTLGGNVMNGSPAMDTGAPLEVLGATVQLARLGGARSVTTNELWVGPGATSAQPDELCVAVTLPPAPERSGSAYVRLEYRRSMEIAVVGAAASVTLAADNTIAACRIALTAVAPTILALSEVDSLNGLPFGQSTLDRVASLAASQAAPISDLRASDTYRRHCVGVIARRAFEAAFKRATGQVVAVPVNRSIGVGANSSQQWETSAS